MKSMQECSFGPKESGKTQNGTIQSTTSRQNMFYETCNTYRGFSVQEISPRLVSDNYPEWKQSSIALEENRQSIYLTDILVTSCLFESRHIWTKSAFLSKWEELSICYSNHNRFANIRATNCETPETSTVISHEVRVFTVHLAFCILCSLPICQSCGVEASIPHRKKARSRKRSL